MKQKLIEEAKRENCLDLCPGVDWSKEDVMFITNSGVEHLIKPEEKMSKNYVQVHQVYDGGGYYFYDCDNYLSLKFYDLYGSFWRVKDFEDDIKNGKFIGFKAHTRYIPYWRRENENGYEEKDLEVRIYKDYKIAIIHHVVLDDADFYYINNDINNQNGLNWGKTLSESGNDDKNITIVYNNSQVEDLSKTFTLKAINELLGDIAIDNFCDLRGREIYYLNSYEKGELTRKTINIIRDFFDITDEDYRWTEFNKKTDHRTFNRDISSIREFLLWCCLKDKASSQMQAKQQHAEYLLEGLEEEWNNPSEYKEAAIWSRKGDDIILILPNYTNTCWYGYGSKCRKIFSYNVKTKKRFYGELDKNNVWSFPIPSLKYINQATYLGNRQERNEDYNYTTESGPAYFDITTKTIIKNNIDVRELFDGTNIAWILDNTDDECKIKDSDNYTTSRYCYNSAMYGSPVNVKKFISNEKIGTIALKILVTTGVPMLEQLLKSKLFNMYFCAMEDLDDRNEIFFDEDKKRTTTYKIDRLRRNSHFTYHSKEKNLKKMFGMSLNTMREIDKSMEYIYSDDKERYSSEPCWHREIPHLNGINEAIGCELTSLDQETLKKCMQLSVYQSNGSYYSTPVWTEIGDVIAEIYKDKPNPKQVITLIDNYKDNLREYRDYLNMRQQLSNIQKLRPEDIDIFSEKRYPLKPSATKRFIPFLNGMIDDRYIYMIDDRYNYTRNNMLNSTDFVNNYQYKYRKACERGDFKVVEESGNKVLGVLIQMTPNENMLYLHDDASYWVGFYQDSMKDGLFKEAVKRVEPLEWTDEKSGLTILAPKDVNELKNEGHILSHCVASYVDPIISGTENIMFLRRIDMINSPFYTVEVLDNGEIRQVHCYANGDLTKEGQVCAYESSKYEVYNKQFNIVDFLTKWAKAMKGKINANSIKSHYGALCAIRN